MEPGWRAKLASWAVTGSHRLSSLKRRALAFLQYMSHIRTATQRRLLTALPALAECPAASTVLGELSTPLCPGHHKAAASQCTRIMTKVPAARCPWLSSPAWKGTQVPATSPSLCAALSASPVPAWEAVSRVANATRGAEQPQSSTGTPRRHLQRATVWHQSLVFATLALALPSECTFVLQRQRGFQGDRAPCSTWNCERCEEQREDPGDAAGPARLPPACRQRRRGELPPLLARAAPADGLRPAGPVGSAGATPGALPKPPGPAPAGSRPARAPVSG